MKRIRLTFLLLFIAITVSDGFNRADSSDLGSNWTPIDATSNRNLQIVSNKVRGSAVGTVAIEVWTGNSFSAWQEASVTLTNIGAGSYHGGVYLRATTDGATLTGYYCLARNTGGSSTSVIGHVVAGSFSDDITENSTTWAANDVLRCTVIGPNLVLYRNGTQLLALTNSTITTGSPGISTYAGSSLADIQLDNFTASSGPGNIFGSGVIQ